MASELKPCPFCGIAPKTQRNRGGGLFIFCGAEDHKEDYSVSADVEGDSDTEDELVIAAWNTRPVEDALVEALKELCNAEGGRRGGMWERARAALKKAGRE